MSGARRVRRRSWSDHDRRHRAARFRALDSRRRGARVVSPRWPSPPASRSTGAMAAQAHAGTYTAWSCRDGANASTQGLPDWSHSSSGVGYVSTPGVVCQTLPPYTTSNPFGTIVYADGSNNPSLVTDDMSLVAPPDTSLSSARLWWRGEARPTGQVAAIAMRPNGTQTALIDRRNTSFPSYGRPERRRRPNRHARPRRRERPDSPLGLLERLPERSEQQLPGLLRRLPSRGLGLRRRRPAGRASGELRRPRCLEGTALGHGRRHGQGRRRVPRADRVRRRRSSPAASSATRPCRDVDPTNNDAFEFSTVRPCPASAPRR